MLESWRLFNALLNPIKGESSKCPVFLSLQIRSDQAPHRSSESRCVVSDSFWPNGLYSPWNSPGQNTGGGSLFLLQGVFPTQGLNSGVPHCRWILYQLSHKGTQVQPVNKSLILSSNNPQSCYLGSYQAPGIWSSLPRHLEAARVGWSGASELSTQVHQLPRGRQRGPKGAEWVPVITELYEFSIIPFSGRGTNV